MEGGAVGVVDEDEEVEGEVELDSDGWEGDAWGDAGDVGGEESGGGVLGLEEDEEEDENDGDEKDDEEEGGGGDDAAAGEAPGWRLFWLEGLGVGYFCHVGKKMRDRKAMGKVEEEGRSYELIDRDSTKLQRAKGEREGQWEKRKRKGAVMK